MDAEFLHLIGQKVVSITAALTVVQAVKLYLKIF